MSNRCNKRRSRQRIRAEIDRKPKRITKAMVAFVSSLPAERKRKEKDAYLSDLRTRKGRKRWSRRVHRLENALGRSVRRSLPRRKWLGKPRKVRKPRTKYGATYWRHSLDN